MRCVGSSLQIDPLRFQGGCLWHLQGVFRTAMPQCEQEALLSISHAVAFLYVLGHYLRNNVMILGVLPYDLSLNRNQCCVV